MKCEDQAQLTRVYLMSFSSSHYWHGSLILVRRSKLIYAYLLQRIRYMSQSVWGIFVVNANLLEMEKV